MDQTGPLLTAEQFAQLSKVIREVSRRGRLKPDDAQEFSQTVHLRLLERNYDAFTRFGGRSSLATYLTVVVRRLLLDWRIARYGKWRPSSGARRLGPDAVALETLIARDGYTTEQAVRLLSARQQGDTAELTELAARLPARQPRRRGVSDEALADVPGPPFDDPIEAEEQVRSWRTVRTTVTQALRRLPSDDVDLLRARCHGEPMRVVAMRLRTDPKLLYRRCDRLLLSLRRELTRAGVTNFSI